MSRGRHVVPVGKVNRYVKSLMDSDALLAGLFVRGEISNYRPHASGHMYFTLKDDDALMGAVMFRGHASELAFSASNGLDVICFGKVSLYEKTGQYQMCVEFMEEAGAGALQAKFNALRDRLAAEGLFDAARKKPLPPFAETIALVTSPGSAAVHDMLRVARARNPAIGLVVVPSSVQGQGAAEELAGALALANEWGGADAIIIGRGGGSAEDLWAFNEEVLARAIAASNIPVISAVGHETDFTIADFVADARAATPSQAAQMATYALEDALGRLYAMHRSFSDRAAGKLGACRERARGICGGLWRAADARLKDARRSLLHLGELLEKVSPQAAFGRGFSLLRDESGKSVTSAAALRPGQVLSIVLADGEAKAQVIQIQKSR